MSTNVGDAFGGSEWSEEYDCVPLRLRLKMLRERARNPDHADASTTFADEDCELMRQDISLIRKEEGNVNGEIPQTKDSSDTLMETSDSPNYGALDPGPEFLSMDSASNHSVDSPEDCDLSRGSTKSLIYSSKLPACLGRSDVRKQQLNIEAGVSLYPTAADVPGDVEIPSQDSLAGSNDERGSKVKHDILYEFDDRLDTVLLGERRRMLLSRKSMESSGSYMTDHGKKGRSSNLCKAVLQDASIEIEMQKSDSVPDIEKRIISGMHGDHEASKSGTTGTNDTMKKCSTLSDDLSIAVSVETKASPTFIQSKSVGGQEITIKDADSMTGSVSSLLARVKDEPVDRSELCVEGKNGIQNFFTGDAMAGSVSSLLARVKNEPVDMSELCNEGKNGIHNFFTGEIPPMKSEPDFSEFLGDELDHLPLIDRIKLLSSGTQTLNKSHSVELLNNTMASALDVATDVLESVKPISISRPRKRKTATNSVATALEEDAPELLKVLMERGVSIEEIKLYGEGESEDSLDDSLSEDGFAELEAVISQLFSQRQSFLKFPLLRFTKNAKASYCLSCLLSLVEQTSYLRHRKWPVEWGWCRDLQSFIFVFERHNRIVLERPEYGFATYFFELLNSIPIDWQIKRLVTAMKLTNCGRITLIENKPLVVGDDLSEGEAKVLAEYGWTPNTGLGTMLNYCDRVVHDRKQDMNSLEWRSKIATQLMNGYNGGNIVSKNLPKKLVEYQSSQSLQVKLEQ